MARSIPENFICCLIDSMLIDEVGSFVDFVLSVALLIQLAFIYLICSSSKWDCCSWI